MISIVRGSVEHVKHMHEIEKESFPVAWSEISIKHEITHKNSICVVAVTQNQSVIGHAYMRKVLNEGHINNLAVKIFYRRRGIGSMLVEGLVSAAQERQIIALTLEVRVSNTAAILLYEKHGFIKEGIRKNYYTCPTEDGIIMWKYML